MNICAGGNGNNSLTRGFAGPVVLAGCQSHCVHDGEAVCIGHRECRISIQEGSPLVILADVFLVCAWHWLLVYATPAYPISVLTM
jgi:hypothetical protein